MALQAVSLASLNAQPTTWATSFSARRSMRHRSEIVNFDQKAAGCGISKADFTGFHGQMPQIRLGEFSSPPAHSAQP
jgi:hypothetical protein